MARPNAEQRQAEYALHQKEHEALSRRCATAFQAWRTCTLKSCKRARDCLGPGFEACIERSARQPTPLGQLWMWELVTAYREGATGDQATEIAISRIRERLARMPAEGFQPEHRPDS